MPCPACNYPSIRRTARISFLQGRVFPLFGCYPWECPKCGKIFIIKDRGDQPRENEEEKQG